MDPILLFEQLLIASTAVAFGIEALRLRAQLPTTMQQDESIEPLGGFERRARALPPPEEAQQQQPWMQQAAAQQPMQPWGGQVPPQQGWGGQVPPPSPSQQDVYASQVYAGGVYDNGASTSGRTMGGPLPPPAGAPFNGGGGYDGNTWGGGATGMGEGNTIVAPDGSNYGTAPGSYNGGGVGQQGAAPPYGMDGTVQQQQQQQWGQQDGGMPPAWGQETSPPPPAQGFGQAQPPAGGNVQRGQRGRSEEPYISVDDWEL